MSDFDLYTWGIHNAIAPIVLLEEEKLSYHLVPTNPTSKLLSKEIKKISPMGEIPILVDQRTGKKSSALFGTCAILYYLAREKDKFIPKPPKLYAETLRWLFWQERVIHGNILMYENAKDEKIKTGCRANIKKSLQYLDTLFKDKQYLAEEISIADIALFFLIRKPEKYSITVGDFSNLHGWVERLSKRSSFQKALEIHFY